jgi:hypothetical protein
MQSWSLRQSRSIRNVALAGLSFELDRSARNINLNSNTLLLRRINPNSFLLIILADHYLHPTQAYVSQLDKGNLEEDGTKTLTDKIKACIRHSRQLDFSVEHEAVLKEPEEVKVEGAVTE